MTIRHNWKPAFLKALSEWPVVLTACKAAMVDRTTATKARNKNAEFKRAWDEAMEEGIDRAEQEAFRRAVVGHEEPVVDKKGNIVYLRELYIEKGKEKWRLKLDDDGNPVPLTTKRHSDTLLNTVLKGRRKDVYSDRTELTGADGGDLTISDPTTRAARVAQLMALAKQRADRRTGADEALPTIEQQEE